MAAMVENSRNSCDGTSSQPSCPLSSSCRHGHGLGSTKSLLKGLTFAALLLAATMSMLTWQISFSPSMSCGEGGCMLILRQWIWLPRVNQPTMVFPGLDLGHVAGSYPEESGVVFGSGPGSDYAEEELRATHVTESAIISALQRGEEADAGEFAEGREEKPSFLVAEIRSKAEDDARLGLISEGKNVGEERVSRRPFVRVNVGDVLKRIGNGAVDSVDYLTNLVKEEVEGPTTVIRAKPGTGRRIYIREQAPVQHNFDGVKEGEPIVSGVKAGRKISIGGDGAVTVSLNSKEILSGEADLAQSEMEDDASKEEDVESDSEEDDNDNGDEVKSANGGSVSHGENKMFEIRRIPGWTERLVVEYPDEERPAVRVVRKARRMMSEGEN